MNSVFFLKILCFVSKGSLNIPELQMFADWLCKVLLQNRTCCGKYRIFQLIIDLFNSLISEYCLQSIIISWQGGRLQLYLLCELGSISYFTKLLRKFLVIYNYDNYVVYCSKKVSRREDFLNVFCVTQKMVFNYQNQISKKVKLNKSNRFLAFTQDRFHSM